MSLIPTNKPGDSVFLANLHHAYALTDGTYEFPKSMAGDLLKTAKREIEELRNALATAPQWRVVSDENLPPLDVPVWLREGGRVWIGGRADDGDGWLWANCYDTVWLEGGTWKGDLETDDDYKPTHWMPLPGLPVAQPEAAG